MEIKHTRSEFDFENEKHEPENDDHSYNGEDDGSTTQSSSEGEEGSMVDFVEKDDHVMNEECSDEPFSSPSSSPSSHCCAGQHNAN